MNSFWVTLCKKMSVGEGMFVLKFICMFWDSKEKKKLWKTYEKEKQNRKERKKGKRAWKDVRMSDEVLNVEERVQNTKSGPKLSKFSFLFKRWVFIQKWILSWFKCFAHYFFKNLCFPYHFFVSQTPQAPLQPLTSILSVMCFNLWSLNLVWAYGVTGSRI